MHIELSDFLWGGVAAALPLAILVLFIFKENNRIKTNASSQIKSLEEHNFKQQAALTDQQQQQQQLEINRARLEERIQGLEINLEQETATQHKLEAILEQTRAQLAERNEAIAEIETRLSSERQSYKENLRVLEQAKKQLKHEFENLANQIFDEKTKSFGKKNNENMAGLLNPLREQLGEFKRKVEDVYDKESKDRRSLYEQIKQLKELNQQMSDEAIKLTSALKGDNKVQGNWGEMILERALEESGLKKGQEFELQAGIKQNDKRFIPDALIYLPDGKHIIIDAKVSLVAYEAYCSSNDENERKRLHQEHTQSLRGHIKNLSDKSYHSLEAVKTLDFVLLFMPIEGAFLLALEKEPNLFREAFEHNIMLVSPATLMVTLRTIHNIWRHEHQNKNAKEIARRGGELHDKFVGFVESIEEIGKNIERTQNSYNTAHKRLTSGRGNLVSQVNMLQKLGADTKKKLSPDLIEQAVE